ncbi:MAG: TIGR03435 family protein [Terriglobus sp.]
MLALLLLSATPSIVSAQQSAHPSFAVTSVKPYAGDPGHFRVSFDGGRAEMERITVNDMLRFCYDLTADEQIVNLPDWAKNDRWDIKATEEEDISGKLENGPLDQRIALMHSLMLELLHDRFALRETKTTRVLPAYALTVVKSGAKVMPADAVIKGFHGLNGPNGNITANGASMALLVMRMSGMSEVQGHPIVDHTGLKGEFSWKLNWTPELAAPAAEGGDLPGLFEALKQQLGLQLVSTKTAVPAIQIDSISKPSPD